MFCDRPIEVLSKRLIAAACGLLLFSLASPVWGQKLANSQVSVAWRGGSQAVRAPQERPAALSRLEEVPPALRATMSLRLQGVTLEEALQRIARETGLTFVYGQSAIATGTRLTVDLEAVSVQAALLRVLRGTGRALVLSSSGQLILTTSTAAGAVEASKAAPHRPAPPPTLKQIQSALPKQLRSGTLLQGSITGTVTSGATGEPLPGVNVLVEGTQQGAATGPEGSYEITGVETGTYTVRASFIGYGDETREGVEVQEGEATVVDFRRAAQ